jgi:hypothetical protein
MILCLIIHAPRVPVLKNAVGFGKCPAKQYIYLVPQTKVGGAFLITICNVYRMC